MRATTRFFYSIVLLCLLSITPEFQAIASDNTVIKRTFTWEYYGKIYSMDYTFRSADYYYYKGLHRTYDDFTVYLREAATHKIIDDFTATLYRIAQKNNLSDWQTVEFISAFVQDLVYKDDGKYEYPRYPDETLVDMGGDCEDTAILLESILRSLNYDCILISPKGHMGVGIALDQTAEGVSFDYEGTRYYYIETTNTGWGIGQYPDHLSSQVIVYDAGPTVNSHSLAVEGGTSKSPSYASNKTITEGYAKNDSGNAGYDNADNSNAVTKDEQFDPDNFHFQAADTEKKDEIIVNGHKQTVITHTAQNH